MSSRDALGRAPLVWWFAAAWVGAWAGVRWHEALTGWTLVLVTLLAPVAAAAVWRRFGRAASGLAQRIGVCLAIAVCVFALSADRVRQFEHVEARFVRGSRGYLSGEVLSIAGYDGTRLALEMRGRAGAALAGEWGVRVIAEPGALVRLAAQSEEEDLRLPVRFYPFRPAGNPGEFDRRKWAMAKGWVATAYLDAPCGIDEGEPCGSAPAPGAAADSMCRYWSDLRRLVEHRPLQVRAWEWRCRLVGGSHGAREGGGSKEISEARALALAMTLGQRDLVSTELGDRFSKAGVAHLLSVSGLHVGFIVLMLSPLLRAPRTPNPRVRGGALARLLMRGWPLAVRGLSILLIIGYVVLVGQPASAWRAGLAALGAVIAGGLGRARGTWNLFGAAGLALLAANPHFVLDLGFQLSFLATAGIIAVAPALSRLQAYCRRRGRIWALAGYLVSGLGVSLAAQLATLPTVAGAFSTASWFSPATNLVAVPLGAVGLIATLSGLLVGEVYAPLGELGLSVGVFACALLIMLVNAVWNLGTVEVVMFSPSLAWGWHLALVAAALLLGGLVRPGSAIALRWGRKLAVFALFLLACGASAPTLRSVLGVVDVWVLDVGQGDSVLIQAPWGRNVLVDGGGLTGTAAASGYDVGEARVVPALKRLGVRRLDLVVNTHPDSDHVQGLGAVIRQRDVKRVVASWAEAETVSYRRFQAAAVERVGGVERFESGETVALGEGIRLRVLASGAPSEWTGARAGSVSANNRSVALALEVRGRRLLLLGDSEEAALERIMALFPEAVLRADALLVPHHGAAVAVWGRFLEKVDPEVAFISAGEGNPFSHPHASTLTGLAERGVRVFRTDQSGALRLRFSPFGIEVRAVRGAGR